MPRRVTNQEKIRTLTLQGHDPYEIADSLGLKYGNVRAVQSILRRSGKLPLLTPKERTVSLPLSNGIRMSRKIQKAIEEEAARRGIDRRDLVLRLIETIVTDNMFKAVLDD